MTNTSPAGTSGAIRVDFKPDNRHGIVPKLEKFPGDY
jgi:hypothetical protein